MCKVNMQVSSINFSNFNAIRSKKTPNSRIFTQKPDVVSFSGKKAFSFTDKGILQSLIDECKDKETVESLLKDENGLYKYRPFIVFEILTQKDKPNFKENLKALQDFELDDTTLYPSEISEILAACDGQDVKPRLELLTSVKENKGIDLPIEIFSAENDKFDKIKKYLEKIDESNKNKTIANCVALATPEITKPERYYSAEERLLFRFFRKPKPIKDHLAKLIESGKYKNISAKALKKYKEEHFWSYAELCKKTQSMPQVLDLINHIVDLGQHSKYKDSWIRNSLKEKFTFENVADLFLQNDSPKFVRETDILRKLLFGKHSPELKARIKDFKKRTGIDLHADSNIPISYIDRFEKIVPDIKNHFGDNSSVANATITSLIQDNCGGFCINAGVNLYPQRTDLAFEKAIYHEFAHVAHKRCIPYGSEENQGRSKAWEDLLDKKFYPHNSIEYKTTVSQLRPYATKNFAEFVAVFNDEVGRGKFNVVINDKGEKVLRKYLKDGDTTTSEDLERLVKIYNSVWGPDIGAKKAPDTNLEYVETPFKGAEKFNFIKFYLSKNRKV